VVIVSVEHFCVLDRCDNHYTTLTDRPLVTGRQRSTAARACVAHGMGSSLGAEVYLSWRNNCPLTRNRAGDLQIFSLTLSQLSYERINPENMNTCNKANTA
jgi:hypothetical protein